MVTMKRIFRVLALSIAFATVAGTGLVQASGKTVDVRIKDGLGAYLVDARGMALYSFQKDSPGRSVCTGPCLEKWPLFYIDGAEVPAALNAADFGTITRDDGMKQTTYKGKPLYYFVGDKDAGDTNGHGLKDIWYVVTP